MNLELFYSTHWSHCTKTKILQMQNEVQAQEETLTPYFWILLQQKVFCYWHKEGKHKQQNILTTFSVYD